MSEDCKFEIPLSVFLFWVFYVALNQWCSWSYQFDLSDMMFRHNFKINLLMMMMMMMIMMMMMMMNSFCGIVDRLKTFSLISSRDHCERSSASRISDMPRAGCKPAQNLSLSFFEWSCTVVITTTPRYHFSFTALFLL